MSTKTLSPEIVSFLLALRAVRRLQEGIGLGCFGQYDETCGEKVYYFTPCIICKKVCTEEDIEWIDALLKAYPLGGKR